MARNRITELFKKTGDNITQRIKPKNSRTEIMPNTNQGGSAVTWIMDGTSDSGPVQISEGSDINGYSVLQIISENTGEATLFLVEREGVRYVLKLYHKNKTPKEELISLIRSIDSPNVIKVLDSGNYYERYYEVLEYYENGDLLSLIPVDYQYVESVIVPSINNGIEALHEKEIIHRDIKPSNIFVSGDKSKVVIGDFGISSIISGDVSVRATSMSRTLGYSAPETSNGFISKESDYYSFGITLYHLVLGQDPFAGMSDMQILYQTINKKIELPQSVPYRIQILIKGLTIKDRNDRWGSEEVERWLAGEDVPVAERVVQSAANRPYKFASESYYEVDSLSMAFAQNWDNAKRHLFRGLVDKYLATFDEEMASQCMDLKEYNDKDLAVFKLIYLLNKRAPLCYKGQLFNDLESLSQAMYNKLPEIDEDIKMMIRSGALKYYVNINPYDQNLKDEISHITNESIDATNNEYYYRVMYLFDPTLGFRIDNARCEDLDDFIDLFCNSQEDIQGRIANYVISNDMFSAWLITIGYENQVVKWREAFKKVVV